MLTQFLNPSSRFARIYIKFILALGFIGLGTGYFISSGAASLKVIFCWAVGIAYFVYGVYNYRSERKKADQGAE